MNESNNRFEVLYLRLQRNKKAVTLITMTILLMVEVLLSSAYLTKRLASDFPVVDLIERFYILKPLKPFFEEQYRFPKELADIYAGEGSLPNARQLSFQADSLRGYIARPSTLIIDMDYFWTATNAQGFHIVDRENPKKIYSPEKPDDVYRIVMLGGSTVAGNGSSDAFEALPAVLQTELRRNYTLPTGDGKTFEIINGGIGGYYSELELMHYLASLRILKPDLVISYNGWNDLRLLNKQISKRGINKNRYTSFVHDRNNQILDDYFRVLPMLLRTLSLTAQSVYNFLDGFALIHIPIRLLHKLMKPNERQEKVIAGKKETPLAIESVQRYVDNEEILFQVNRIDGIPTAWFMQPLVGLGNKPPADFREKENVSLLKNNIKRRQGFYELATPELERLAKKYSDKPLLCAASLIDVFDGNSAALYEDFGHLFVEGNIIVATRIAKELSRCGLIQRK
jgi:hypothetical protein